MAADALSRQEFAGEPESKMDTDFDDCIAICNLVNRGTALDPELVTLGFHCCNVRQIQAGESGFTETLESQENKTSPGYTKEQIVDFQILFLDTSGSFGTGKRSQLTESD